MQSDKEAVSWSKERVERAEAVGIRFLFIGRLRVGSQAGLCLKVLYHAGSPHQRNVVVSCV